VQDSLLVAHLQEALKSERKDKERAWEQNDFLKDELARSRKDNEALRGKAQELARVQEALREKLEELRKSRQEVSRLLASQPAARAGAADGVVVVTGPEADFGFDQWG
jgi:uncharacterized protein YlxW (UPF0749 family)